MALWRKSRLLIFSFNDKFTSRNVLQKVEWEKQTKALKRWNQDRDQKEKVALQKVD